MQWLPPPVLTPGQNPLLDLQEFTALVAGLSMFSKISLILSYHQVLDALDDICKTAIVTSFGVFEFLCMPLELHNAGKTFQ